MTVPNNVGDIVVTDKKPDAGGRLGLRLLGGFVATRGGAPLTGFAYDKVRALFALLVIESGTAYSRERLADMFWPSVGGDAARNYLRHALHNLRQVLGPDKTLLLDEGRRTLRCNPDYPMDTDVWPFAAHTEAQLGALDIVRLEALATLYQGPLLVGLALPDTPEFDHWLHQKREHYLRRALNLHQRLAEHYASSGDARLYRCQVSRQLALAPWQESHYRDLMRCHAESGETSEALQIYETCRRYLREELSISPDPLTVQLAERIRRRELMPSAPRVALAQTLASVEVAVASPWQRLPVTVLTCLLQPEQASAQDSRFELLAAPRETCEQALRSAGGHCVTLHAGELKAYFGYPAPRELAPRMALEAALDIATRLRPLSDIEFSIGVHTGWMLADDRYALPDAAGELSRLSGELAARAACAITVSPTVYAATEGYFRFSEYLAEDGAWYIEASGQTDAFDRLEAAREADHQLTPLVGRKSELAWLREQWQLAVASGPRRVLISGDAGIGKSRLMQAAAQYIQRRGARHIDLRCRQNQQQTPYFPLTDYFRRRFENPLSDPFEAPAQERLSRLASRIAADDPAFADCLPALAALLSLPSTLDVIADGGERRRVMEEAILQCLGKLCATHPMLFTLEDAHWADPSTLGLLDRLTAPAQAPRLWLTTSRQADSLADATALTLTHLDAQSARSLVSRASGGDTLAPQQIADIVARTDGVPLYIEQMVRSVFEGEGDKLPPNLGDLLASRLETLGVFRPLAQFAAVIGREFDREMLAWLWDESLIPLSAGLERMCSAELVQHVGSERYSFRHALIRDAAYQSLSAAQRRATHARLASALRRHHAQQVEEQPQLLAHHLDAADDPQAAAAWLRAATCMAARSAQQEAAAYCRLGLAALAGLRGTSPDQDLEFRLHISLGNALVALQGYGSEEAQHAYARAQSLSATISDDDDLFQLMWGLWLGGRSATGERPSLEFTDKLRAIAEHSDNPATRAMLDYAYGNNYFWLGQPALARRHLEQAIASAERADSREMIARFGEDGGVTARAFLSWTLWIEGDLQAAERMCMAALARARALGHTHSLAYALTFSAVLQRHIGFPAKVLVDAGELMALSVKNGLLLWQAVAAAVSGWAMAQQGDPAALVPIRKGIEGARQAMLIVETTFLAFLAEALFRLGDFAGSEEVVDECITKAVLREDFYFLAEFHRLKGELQRARLAPDAHAAEAAERCFAAGMAIAERQGAHLLALRLATSQARLWATCGRRVEAVALLAQHTARFHVCADYPDPHAAFALLAELSP